MIPGTSTNGHMVQSAPDSPVEKVLSGTLYTGAYPSSTTFDTGVDMTGGAFNWFKQRSGSTPNANGYYYNVNSTTVRANNAINLLNSFDTSINGVHTVSRSGSNITLSGVATDFANNAGGSYICYTFKKAARCFDVVSYTGNGTNNRTVAHSLGVTPGFAMVKAWSGTNRNWAVSHRSSSGFTYQWGNWDGLRSTGNLGAFNFNSTNFTLPNNVLSNASNVQYVAYLFAHDTATDGRVLCDTVTTGSSGYTSITLGWEPEFIMLRADINQWGFDLYDAYRPGFGDNYLFPEYPDGEFSSVSLNGAATVIPNSTGFQINTAVYGTNRKVIFVAFRKQT